MNTDRQIWGTQNARSGRQLSGLEKASVLITSLDPESSAKVVEYLTPEERRMLSARILSLQNVDASTRQAVLSEVSGALANRKFASEAEAQSRRRFVWLESVEPSRVAIVLAAMKPQDAALVLSHLSAKHALAILSCMKAGAQDRITQRLADSYPADELFLSALDDTVFAAINNQPNCLPERKVRSQFSGTLFGKVLRVLQHSLARHICKLVQIIASLLRTVGRSLSRKFGGLLGQRHKVEIVSRRPII